jgi:hypothetical protein
MNIEYRTRNVECRSEKTLDHRLRGDDRNNGGARADLMCSCTSWAAALEEELAAPPLGGAVFDYPFRSCRGQAGIRQKAL